MPGLLGPRGVRGTARRVGRRTARRNSGGDEQAAAANPTDELKKLSELKDSGAITAEEYDAKKAKLLDQI